ncbi:ricin-type beta-trefoil lectin domain protein [Streptomyces sp. NPDC050428]|uniref:ricin-type beta-trefoil lectin domain protein n=1 Tax=Streptomyces sp. NPDC050428 TaxID=3155757 RepID=UPI0034249D87
MRRSASLRAQALLSLLVFAIAAALVTLTQTAATAAPAAPAAPAPAESNGGVRIMPLGDSITHGYNIPGGYRINLWQHLATGGYTVDFVGSQVNGPPELGDHDHQGHSGWRIDQLRSNIDGWLAASDPRTIMLQIGTNDVNQNYDLANAPARLSDLIDRILQQKPQIELFVATITPEESPALEERVKTFNAALPGIVSGMGPRVHLVHMHKALTVADLADGVHPNAAGYAKMATVWYNALRSVPASLVPLGVTGQGTLVNAQSGRCLDVEGAVATAGTRTIVYDCHRRVNQQWARTASNELRVYGNRCLDASGAATADGTPVIIWDCRGTANQQWRVNADGTVVGVASGKCLTPVADGTVNGTKLELRTCDGASGQRWTMAA